MAYNYMNILGIYYPNIEASCEGDPTNYDNIIWISSPISKLNLETSYDAGGFIELNSIPGFSEFEYAESPGVSSSNSASWVVKVNLNFYLVQDSIVLFRQSGCVYVGTSSRQILTRLILDNTTVINNTNFLLNNTDRQVIDSISRKYLLTAGSHTLSLQYCRGASTTTVYIENSSISIIKGD